MSTKYNGWTNYETWNVALWIGNDEGLYRLARECKRSPEPYVEFARTMREFGVIETPDRVSYTDSGLDVEELDEMIKEL